MKRSRVTWSIALCAVVLLLGGGAVFVHRLLYTPEGLDLLLRQLAHLQTVHIEVSGTHGVLAGPLSADKVVVDHEAVHIEARHLGLQPQWRGALTGLVTVYGVSVGSIEVTLKKREKLSASVASVCSKPLIASLLRMMRAFCASSCGGENAVMIFRFDAPDKSIDVLQKNGMTVLPGAKLYGL